MTNHIKNMHERIQIHVAVYKYKKLNILDARQESI